MIYAMQDNPTLFYWGKSIEKDIEKREAFTQSTEKKFLVDPLNTNNAIRDSLTLNYNML